MILLAQGLVRLLAFVLLPWQPGFVSVYTLLFAGTALFLLAALPTGSAAKESPAGRYLIEVPGGTVQPALLAAVTAWCADRAVLPSSLQIESRTLEDVFLELTGKDLRG